MATIQGQTMTERQKGLAACACREDGTRQRRDYK